MARFAVLVGCEEYSDPALYKAPFCHADVQMFSKTLTEYCDIEKHNILELLFSFDNVGDPETILHMLRNLGKRTEEGDTVLFFFSGHGLLNEDGEAYLALPKSNTEDLPATALSIRSLNDVLRLERRKNVRILDTCHSGFDARDARTAPQFLESITSEAHGWVTLASCHPSEQSFVDHDRRQGVFTAALCDAIADGFSPDDDILPELLKLRVCSKVDEYVRNNPTKRQTPTLNGSITGNFEILRRRPVSQSPPTETPTGTDVDRLERLRGLRRFADVGNKDHRELLLSYMGYVRECFGEAAGSFTSLDGESLELFEPTRCDLMPLSFSKEVTSTAERKGWESLHTVVVEREYEELDFIQRFTRSFEPARLKSIKHKVEQPASWPESYTEAVLLTSGYLPGIRIGFYLLPLRVSAKLFGLRGTISDGKRQDQLTLIQCSTATLALKPQFDRRMIAQFITDWVARSVRAYQEVTDKRIEALEREVVDLAAEVRRTELLDKEPEDLN